MTNAVMASVPGHPLWTRIQRLMQERAAAGEAWVIAATGASSTPLGSLHGMHTTLMPCMVCQECDRQTGTDVGVNICRATGGAGRGAGIGHCQWLVPGGSPVAGHRSEGECGAPVLLWVDMMLHGRPWWLGSAAWAWSPGQRLMPRMRRTRSLDFCMAACDKSLQKAPTCVLLPAAAPAALGPCRCTRWAAGPPPAGPATQPAISAWP